MSTNSYTAIRELARNISSIENNLPGFEKLLVSDSQHPAKVIGITGPPGSGKSTLADALIGEMLHDEKKVAVLCVDPSSPFNRGALLGDRIRMSNWYNHPDVFIRSLASRGSLGGLHPHIIEISEYVKKQNFDYVIIETVGVGQSEVDIAALADLTIVVLTPEGGDSIQSMKSGLMEIANLFVVNKSDRPGADVFYNNLKKMLGPVYKKHENMLPVFRVTATLNEGISSLYGYLKNTDVTEMTGERKQLLVQKGYQILQSKVMKDIDRSLFEKQLKQRLDLGTVNLFVFADEFLKTVEKSKPVS